MQYALGGRKAVRVALASLLLAASACNSNSDGDRGTAANTVATEPAPVTTTTTNPYAVPAVIDIAYVNRVLAGLDAAVGEVIRMVMAAGTIPPEAHDRLRSIYADPDRLQRAIDGLQRDIRNRFAGYRASPGNQVTVTTQLVTARPNCIFAQVNRDYSPVGTNPLPNLDVQWVGLKPLDRSRDPKDLNVTLWAFVYDGFQSDRSRPPDPCVT